MRLLCNLLNQLAGSFTGLAAPAIAAGFSALAPTLHALVPIIGASGFAAIATAAGHTAGSVAVAASFGGDAFHISDFPFIFCLVVIIIDQQCTKGTSLR
jgi:membrane protein DedA with SNARE-associated domain